MADNKITIQLQGPEGEEDLLNFNHFLELLHSIKEGLNHLEHLITNRKETVINYHVTNLKHTSPYAIEITPTAKEEHENITGKVVSEFINGVSHIEDSKKIPDYYDSQMLDIVKRIGRKRNKYFSDITINNSESSTVISPRLERNVIDLIGDDRKMYGSVTGMLEQLNIHNEVNKFFIYPSVGPSKVECNFPSSLLKEAIGAMAHRVKVKGKLKYKEKDRFPYKVFVDEIEIYPPEEDLPTLKDLRGIAPDITGNMTTTEFINHIRKNDE